MLKKSSIVSILLTAAIFILLEVAALSMVIHGGELQNIWISRFSHSVMNTLWGSSESVRDYFSLKGQNEDLAQENYRLNLQVTRLRQALGQEGDGSDIVGDGYAGEFRFIPAAIVTDPAASVFLKNSSFPAAASTVSWLFISDCA